MKCSKAKKLIPRYLDSELQQAVADELQKHMSVCPDCRSEEEQLRSALTLMDQWSPVEPVGSFEGVLGRLEQPTRARMPRFPVPSWAAAALAVVSLATGAVLGVYTVDAPPTQPPAQSTVLAAMDIDSFVVNDMLEASIAEGLSGDEDASGEVVTQ